MADESLRPDQLDVFFGPPVLHDPGVTDGHGNHPYPRVWYAADRPSGRLTVAFWSNFLDLVYRHPAGAMVRFSGERVFRIEVGPGPGANRGLWMACEGGPAGDDFTRTVLVALDPAVTVWMAHLEPSAWLDPKVWDDPSVTGTGALDPVTT
jgi:hypothetical protein